MIYGSVCSGIEAATVAWRPLGWRAAFLSEIELFPRAVLQHRYPGVPLHGDFTTIEAGEYEPIDLLVGGTPCQSFSVAGKRLGLDDPRGNLAIEYLGLARRLRPRWLVWENVPGVLSSNGGRDFGAFLGLLGECGYGWAYRVLDAQYVRVDGFARAVPQRRRRVFVVGYSGDWRPPAAVLFEPEGLRGDSAPRRETGERVAGPVTASAGTERKHGHGWGQQEWESGFAVPLQEVGGRQSKNQNGIGLGVGVDADVMYTLQSGQQHGVAHALSADGFDASEDGTGRGTPLVPVAFDWQSGGDCRGLELQEAAQLQREQTPAVLNGWAVRRLTPRECERLQGLPDDWTLVPYRKGMAKDGPRYKAIGNAMAVNCMRWIGRRIEAMETVLQQARAA